MIYVSKSQLFVEVPLKFAKRNNSIIDSMAPLTLVNIGSGNGLMPDSSKPALGY